MPSPALATEHRSLEADAPAVVDAVRTWVARAVIGLNLCPFARAPFMQGRVRFAVTPEVSHRGLVDALMGEANELAAVDRESCETTLLIAPLFGDGFLAFLGVVSDCERRLRRLGLDGVFQLATFHPDYVFRDGEDADSANRSNRAPYAVLQLLRERSVADAVDAVGGSDGVAAIVDANQRRLRGLSDADWAAVIDSGARR